jgi:hypothetical protein
MFMRWNGLGQSISLQEFQRKGQGTGFWLPITTTGTRGSTTVVSAPAPAVADIVNAALEARGLAPLDAFTSLQSALLTENDVRSIVETELGNLTVPASVISAVMNEVTPQLTAFLLRLDAVEMEVSRLTETTGAFAEQLATINTALYDADGNARFTTSADVTTSINTALSEAGLVDEDGKAVVTGEQLATINTTLFDADGNARFVTSEDVTATISTALNEAGLVDANGQKMISGDSTSPWGLVFFWLVLLTLAILAVSAVLSRVRRSASESKESLTNLAASRVQFDLSNSSIDTLMELKPKQEAVWKAQMGGKTFKILLWREEGDAPHLIRTNLYRSTGSTELVTDPLSLKRGFTDKLARAIFEGRAEVDQLPFVRAKAA